MILQDGAPDISEAVKNRKFNYIDLKFSGNRDSIRTKDIVFIGDSQLHSAVYGSGLPEFYMSAIGGDFRWGSKSWGGFSLPEIYLDVVPDTADQPRVVVASFLPKYLWVGVDPKSGKPKKSKYTPKPLPAFAGATTASNKSSDVATGPFEGRVKITKISQKPTNDPSTLDYDEALMHVAAEVVSGPLKGQEIGLRYWILHDGAWTGADGKVRVNQRIRLTAIPFTEATSADRALGQHQVFDDTEQDLTVPIYWVTEGMLSPETLLK